MPRRSAPRPFAPALERLADRVIMLADGKVALDAKASEMDRVRERFQSMARKV